MRTEIFYRVSSLIKEFYYPALQFIAAVIASDNYLHNNLIILSISFSMRFLHNL